MSAEDQPLLLPTERAMASVDVPLPSPKVVSALIARYRLLIDELIPDPITPDNITSRDGIVTPAVERAFAQGAGDWPHAAPYALIEASRDLRYLAGRLGGSELADQRALVAEVLARRLAARGELAWRLALKDRRGTAAAISAGRVGLPADSPWEMDASHLSLTRKYQRLTADGEPTPPASTLEAGVDGNCLLFLASPEVQGCVQALWTGHLVKTYADSGETRILPYHETEPFLPSNANSWDLAKFWARHFNPQRLGTPMYSYWISISLWLVFLVLYTLSMRAVKEFDIWEASLWVFALGFLCEDVLRWFKLGGLDKVDFWVIVDILTDTLFAVSFICRVAGFSFPPGSHQQELWQLRAFQFLACLAPLIWFQLLRVADNVQFFGIVEVIIFAMLKQTAIFFVLLIITAVGFAQALYGLDMADGQQVPDLLGKLANSLTQSVLGDPDYDLVAEAFGYPFGRVLYYCLTFMTSLILSNILVAFFNSAYEDVVDQASAYARAYFAQKVVAMVRAPDEFVYLAPFNLIEALFIAPFERCLPRAAYVRINAVVQSIVYCVPLAIIALYESVHDAPNARSIALHRRSASTSTTAAAANDTDDVPAITYPDGQPAAPGADVGADLDAARLRDPDVDGDGESDGATGSTARRRIATVPFAELVRRFPNSNLYDDGGIREQQESTLQELADIKAQLAQLTALLAERTDTRTKQE